MGISLIRLNGKENLYLLAMFDRKEISHLGALKIAIFRERKFSPKFSDRSFRNPLGSWTGYPRQNFPGF